MQVSCPDCRREVPPSNVNEVKLIAVCRHCSCLFEIEGDHLRPPIQQTEKFSVETSGNMFSISYRWIQTRHIFTGIFALLWWGFLIFYYASLLLTADSIPPMAIYLPLAHVAIGIGVGYYALAGLLNTSKLTVSRGVLTVIHEPIPWPGVDLDTLQIEQIFCRRYIIRNKGSETITYQLLARLRDGKNKKLITGFKEDDLTLYMKQELKKFLNIQTK